MRRILPVVGVVVLVLVLGFVVLGSCSGSSAADKYRSYVQDVNSVARQSNNDAKALDAVPLVTLSLMKAGGRQESETL